MEKDKPVLSSESKVEKFNCAILPNLMVDPFDEVLLFVFFSL